MMYFHMRQNEKKKNTRVSDKKVLMTFIENIGTY